MRHIIVVASALLIACGGAPATTTTGGTAQPVANVQATVDASVKATVAAQTSAQPTSAQPTAAPTVVPVANTPRVTQAATATPTPAPVARQLKTEEWPLVLSDPNKFKGSQVTITGQIFNNPERDASLVVFQIFTDPEKSDGNTVVASRDAGLKVDKSQYVRVAGIVRGKFDGSNAFGGKVTAPIIDASKVEILSRADVLAPAFEVIQIDRTVTQHGLEVTLEKIELAQTETRAYVRVKNTTQTKANAYDYQAVIVQDGKQLKRKTAFNSGYPEIDDTL